MIILLSPLLPQDEYYLLWGPRQKDYDLRYPLWYPGESESYQDLASDIHVIFYTTSIPNENVEQVQLIDNVLTVFSTDKPALPEKIFKCIESFIKEHFYADYLVYIPGNIFLLLKNLKSSLSGQGERGTSLDLKSPFYKNLSCDQGHAYKIETGLLCTHNSKPDLACFSIDPQVDTVENIRQKAGLLLNCHPSAEDSNPGVMHTGQGQPFEPVSLGGWCGPAEALRMLKVRKKALPFDYIHSSLEGVNKIFDGEESAFYPWPGFNRSRYTVFPHHDLGLDETVEIFQQRFSRLWCLLKIEKPIIFIRTVVNPDHRIELEQVKLFVKILKEKYQRFDDRIVLIFHDQKVGTVQLQPIDKNIMAWSAQGKVGWTVPNRHEISYSYNKIISDAMNDSNWPPQPQIKQHLLLDHDTPEIYNTLYDDLLPAKPELMINWSAQEQTPLLWRELEQPVLPVLIGGCPHSGATLLCSILSAHPDIFTFSCNYYEPLSNHDGIAHTGATLDFTTLYERQLKDLKGKYSHWCECSQANIFYVPEIIEKFGEDARVIHVVRDGRDVITANLQEETHRIRVKPERWLEYISAGMKFDACPQVLLVRYEDLVFRFDETMLAICEFIGVDFIFDLHKFQGMLFDDESNAGKTEKKNFIGYSSPGNWKKSPEKELLLDFLSRPEAISFLNHYGYMKQPYVSVFHRIVRPVRLRIENILSSAKYMKSLRQLPGRIKRKLLGHSMPVLDLIEIHVAIPGAQVKCLYFDKATRVELIRQSVALLLGVEKEYVQLFQGDTLLDDNLQVHDLLADDQGDIEIAVIISRFISAKGLFWQDEQFNAFPDRPLSDSAREQADWFYEQNELDSAKRIEQLKGILSDMGNAGSPFVIMAFSSNYTSIFINWVRSCDIHNIAVRERAIIFPMDEKSREVADNEGFKVCFDNSSRVLSNITHSQNYGDAEFTKHMFFQNAIIRDVLALGCDFLFQDVDLVWLEDPFEYFSSSETHDIEFMFDGRTKRHGPLCANTGFIYFHVHPATVSFWEIIYRNSDRVIEFRSQQEPLNRYLGVLHTRGLNVNLLPEELFANGHLFNPDTEKGRLPKNPKVVHCSWTLNAEKKIEKYKNNNLWFISDD